MTARHALPLYLQVSEMLIREIHAGRLADKERLPPERIYAAQLGVSIGTLRKALDTLADKGLLERVQGSGNYIRARADVQSVYAFFRVELLEGGGLPTAELLSVKRLPKPDALPAFGVSDFAHRIRRLRRLNKIPAVVEEIWLDGSYADHIAPEDLSESLYLFYRDRLNLWITQAQDRISLGPVPRWAPKPFGPKPGTACLCATRYSIARDGVRAEISRGWIDTEVATYVARLT